MPFRACSSLGIQWLAIAIPGLYPIDKPAIHAATNSRVMAKLFRLWHLCLKMLHVVSFCCILLHFDELNFLFRAFLPMFQVNVSFPSGCCETLSLPELSTAGDLKILAQRSLRQGFLKLVTVKGHVLSNPKDSCKLQGCKKAST